MRQTGAFAEVNGWRLFAHPAFGQPLHDLIEFTGALEKRSDQELTAHPKAKLLKRVLDLVLREIPRDPNAAEYQLGNTMGTAYRHWRRANFLGRFRLFFRFSSTHKAIVYAWVNDENTLRKAGARSDPYVIFAKRLVEGDPSDNWDALYAEASAFRLRMP